jgi:salicylate hydroxylase
MRTQRKRLQDALLAHIPDGSLKLAKKLTALEDLGPEGVMLYFADETASLADLVVGADGIRSVVRDSVWKNYQLKYTGTSVFRVLLPIATLSDLDPIFGNTAWWHGPSAHIYFSPVGEGLWEIAARVSMDPEVHAASKRSWGVPVKNDVVEGYFAVWPFVRTITHWRMRKTDSTPRTSCPK